LHSLHHDGLVAAAEIYSNEVRRPVSIRFGSYEFTIGRVTPEVGATGTEESAGEATE
jgi:hypothetical protein